MVISEKDSSFARDLGNSLRTHLSAEELSKLRTDRERIQFVLQNKAVQERLESCIQNLIKNEKNSCAKNKVKALQFKDLGNSAFGRGHYDKSLQLYNQCIAWMPHDDTKDISIAYANRSAALFHLGEISLAQKDVKIAFTLNYPKELHWKLYERSGRCHLQQNNMGEANRQFKLALTALQDAQLDESKKKKGEKVLEQLMRSNSSNFSANCTDSKRGTESDNENILVPELTRGESKSLRGAASCLSVDRNEEDGRFVVANEDIQPGDVILVQKAYISTLSPELYHQQCSRCFTPMKAPVFCKSCSMESYCSLPCREKARTEYHGTECKIMGVLANAGISITCYMALRLMSQTGVKKICKWAQLVNEMETGVDGEDKNVKVKSPPPSGNGEKSLEKKGRAGQERETWPTNEEYRADHISLLHLVTHSKRREMEDIFQRTIMTFFLLKLLKSTGFLSTQQQQRKSRGEASGENSEEENKDSQNGETTKTGLKEEKEEKEEAVAVVEENEDEVSVGTLLLRSLQFLQFNAHEIAGWDSQNSTSVFLGGGLFLSLALFNHSCNPAIVRYFMKDTVVVRAVRTIYRGEQVTENYGPVFTSSPREERRRTLDNQYWFHCQCICCREDWPQFEGLATNSGLRFRCTHCHCFLGGEDAAGGLLLQCGRCSRPTNILKSLKDLQKTDGKYNDAMNFLAKGREETALGILLQNIALFDSILLPPFRDYHLCQEAVRRCFLILGNKTNAQTSSSSATP